MIVKSSNGTHIRKVTSGDKSGSRKTTIVIVIGHESS